jgi:hypothetical protein
MLSLRHQYNIHTSPNACHFAVKTLAVLPVPLRLQASRTPHMQWIAAVPSMQSRLSKVVCLGCATRADASPLGRTFPPCTRIISQWLWHRTARGPLFTCEQHLTRSYSYVASCGSPFARACSSSSVPGKHGCTTHRARTKLFAECKPVVDVVQRTASSCNLLLLRAKWPYIPK